jgi:hypothetical protein
VCQHNDVLSLLEGKIQFCVRVALELEMRDDDEPSDAERTLIDANAMRPPTAAATNAATRALFGRAATNADQHHESFELIDPDELQTVLFPLLS